MKWLKLIEKACRPCEMVEVYKKHIQNLWNGCSPKRMKWLKLIEKDSRTYEMTEVD